MSRIILNQIALQKIKVISETKKYFLLQPSSAAAPSTSNYGITPPTYTQTGYNGWSDTEPSYTMGDERVLYELTETIYSDRTWDYSTPTVSSSYEAAKEAYNEAIQAEEDIQDFVDLGLKQGYIWDNPTSKPASGTIPVYPAGSYIASGILSGGTRSINRSNSNTYGLNTWISTGGINLRYNAIDLMKLTTSNLFFYYPSTSTQQKKAISLGTNGTVNSLAFYGFNNDNKTMELTNNALTFYNPSNGTDKLATLNTSGLILSKGGVKAGTPNQSGFIYLSTEPYGSYSVNGSSGISDWKEIIGTKFGVRADGTLYANNAIINGAITATSLTIGSNATINDASGLVRNDAIDIGGRNLFQNSTQILSNGSVTDTKNYFMLYLWSVPEESYTGYKTVMPGSKNITTTGYFSYTFIAAAESQAYWALKHNGSSHDFVLYFENSIDIKAGDELTLSFDVIGCDPSVENGLQIENFKLEKGNKATDWTPAPEDIQNALGNKTENSDFDEYKEAVGKDIQDISDSAFGDEDSLSTKLNDVSTEFDKLSGEYGELADDIKTYMSFNGALVLGNSENGNNVTITDSRVQFKNYNDEVGYIDGDGLHVNNYLSFGDFMFYQRTNGHFTLKYLKKEDNE